MFTLLAYSVVKFRKRARDDGREPPHVWGSNQVELAWTIIPILIVVALLRATARVIALVQKALAPSNAIAIMAIGHPFGASLLRALSESLGCRSLLIGYTFAAICSLPAGFLPIEASSLLMLKSVAAAPVIGRAPRLKVRSWIAEICGNRKHRDCNPRPVTHGCFSGSSRRCAMEPQSRLEKESPWQPDRAVAERGDSRADQSG